MKTIFSQNHHHLKSDPHSSANTYAASKKVIHIHESEDSDPKSVLNRIKLNNQAKKGPKHISLKKGDEDDSNEFDIGRIQKRPIRKDLNKVLTRSKADPDSGFVLKSENQADTNAKESDHMSWNVVLKNLPQGVTEQYLRDMIDEDSVIEIKIENQKAEIHLNGREAAKQARDVFNDRIIRGSKVKAVLFGEIKISSNQEKPVKVDSREAELPVYYRRVDLLEKKEDDEDANEGEKVSILERIKKNN